MSRYIDVSNLDIPSDENDYDELVAFADKIAEMIVDAPSIDIPHSDDWERYSERLWKTAYERGKADRPQGEWILFPMGYLVCSVCGSHHSNSKPCNYCDNCGAQMKGADDE